MTRAVLTLAIGPQVYFEMACNLARSFLWWHRNSDIQFILATDSKARLPSDLIGITLMPLECGRFGVGFSPKLHLDKISPAQETLFIDADCLIVGNLNSVFDRFSLCAVSVVGHKESEGEFFGDIASRCKLAGVPWVPRFCGGIYFFKRGLVSTRVFELARDFEKRYDELGFVRLRGMPNEEPLIGLAMAKQGEHPIEEDGTIKAEPMYFTGRTELDVLMGRARLFNVPGRERPFPESRTPEEARPLIVHFNCAYAEQFPYTTEALRLRKVLRDGWPAILATVYAWLVSTAPFFIAAGVKDFSRPLYRAIAGCRPVKRSSRL